MAYDEGLAERIRELVRERPGVVEKKMFGGVAFLISGNMFVGIVREDLMVRIGPESYDAALKKPHVRKMDFTGRPMKGIVLVDAPAIEEDEDLERWVVAGLAFAESLPPK